MSEFPRAPRRPVWVLSARDALGIPHLAAWSAVLTVKTHLSVQWVLEQVVTFERSPPVRALAARLTRSEAPEAPAVLHSLELVEQLEEHLARVAGSILGPRSGFACYLRAPAARD